LKKMQWLIFSKAERERLHPLNVALFLVAMLSVPFFLTTHLIVLLIFHLLFFIGIREWTVFRYLLLPLLYVGLMYAQLLVGASIDAYGIWMTGLTGMVLAIVPSLLRTWPEVKMSHPKQSLDVKLERIALYHLLPIEAVPSRLQRMTHRDVLKGLLIGGAFYGLTTPFALGAAFLLPLLLIFSKGGLRDAYYHYRRNRLA